MFKKSLTKALLRLGGISIIIAASLSITPTQATAEVFDKSTNGDFTLEIPYTEDGSVKIECWGAKGGADGYIWDNGFKPSNGTSWGGSGGYAKATFTDNQLDGKTLYIHVASIGGDAGGGGGGGGSGEGGQASFVTLESGGLPSFKDKKDKVLIVAGGGGGASRGIIGQAGGTGGDFNFGKGQTAGHDGGGGGQGWKGGTCGKDAEEAGSGDDKRLEGGVEAKGGTNRINSTNFTVTDKLNQSGVRNNMQGRVRITYTPCQHTSKIETIIKSPSCLDEGEVKYKCNKCGLEWTEKTPALGHDEPSDYSYATNNGVTDGKKYKNCKRCGLNLFLNYRVVTECGDWITSTSGDGYYEVGASVTIDAVVQSNCTFIDWTGHYTSTDKQSTFTMPNKAVKTRANALPDYIDIIYDKNHETVNKYGDTVTSNTTGNITSQRIYRTDTSASNIKYNKTDTGLGDTAFERLGYYFTNWKETTKGTIYNENQSVTWQSLYNTYKSMSITLKAQWEPIKYNIVYKGNWNWNTSQGDYSTNNVRYDQEIQLADNKFTRSDNTTIDGVHYLKGYQFIGWGDTEEQTTYDYADKEVVKNLRTTAGTKNLYALWKKGIVLNFNMNGGINSDVSLSATIYNSQKDYTFNIVNGETAASLPKYTKQNGKIDAYGQVISNGMNSLYRKVGPNGADMRFLGWGESGSNEPIWELCPYNTNKKTLYTIHDTTTLYAIWEDMLVVDIEMSRQLGKLEFKDGSKPKESLKGLRADSSGNSISTIIRPGEQGYYSIGTITNEAKLEVKFDTDITKIYDMPDKYTDNLNLKDSESLTDTQKHGLNRQFILNHGNNMRKFYMPIYLGERNKDESTGKIKNIYSVQFTASKPSYYYDKVHGTDEIVNITGLIFISTSVESDETEIGGTLNDLKSEVKIRVQQ